MKMTHCIACGKEVAESAKRCPNCGAKVPKPITKKWWFWVIIVIVAVIVIGSMGGGSNNSSNSSSSNSADKTKEEPAIEYTSITADELYKALKDNAAAAKDTYCDNYYAIEGKLSTIDSDLAYISITSLHEDWDLIGVTCDIQNEEQEEVVKSLKSGQKIIVKGKITDVGEIMGYDLDIDEIIPE